MAAPFELTLQGHEQIGGHIQIDSDQTPSLPHGSN